MIKGYIYIITNSINDKVYIGRTLRSLNKRFTQHKRDAINGHIKYSDFYKDMVKFGAKNFKISSLKEIVCDNRDKLIKELNLAEQKQITLFKDKGLNLYNIANGGYSGDIIHLLSEKDKKEISEKKSKSLKEYWKDKGHLRSGENNGMFGRTHTNEIRKVLSDKAKLRTGRLAKQGRIYEYNGELVYGAKGVSQVTGFTAGTVRMKMSKIGLKDQKSGTFKLKNKRINQEYEFKIIK